MGTLTAKRIAIATFAITIGLLAVQIPLSAGREEPFDTVLFSLISLAFGTCGSLIVARQPGNAIGWIFVAQGLSSGLTELGEGWAYVAADEDLPGATVGEWVISWSWILDFAVFSAIFQLFPTGRPLTRRWGAWLYVAAAGAFCGIAGLGFDPNADAEFTRGSNPLGIDGFPAGMFLGIGLLMLFASLLAGFVSLVVRYRRGNAVERQQLQLVGLAAALLLVMGGISATPYDGEFLWYSSFLIQLGIGVALAMLPVSAAIAILRYRLYDIEVVINRTLVYATLTASLAAVYIGSVLLLQLALGGITSDSNLAIAGSTLAVAALFRPARSRIQEGVDRRFYRSRYDARQTLESFSTRLRDEIDLGALDAELRSVVSDTMRPAHVSVWLRDGKTA